MRLLRIVVLMFLLVSFSQFSFGQSNIYSTITKNINAKAASLKHDLNASGDTLLLKSIYDLSKIEIINNNKVQVISITENKKEVAIPLNTLEVGDYTISVLFIEGKDENYIYSKTVVFKVARLQPILDSLLPNSRLAIDTDTDNNTVVLDDLQDDRSRNTLADFNSKRSKKETNPLYNNDAILSKVHNKSREADYFSKPTVENEKRLIASEASQKLANLEDTEVIFVPYSLSGSRRFSKNKRYIVQTRAEYRKANLRPNGKPYD
ncbi:hypothetical protein ACW5R3_11040 [Bizionia sp. KMM 8389]